MRSEMEKRFQAITIGRSLVVALKSQTRANLYE